MYFSLQKSNNFSVVTLPWAIYSYSLYPKVLKTDFKHHLFNEFAACTPGKGCVVIIIIAITSIFRVRLAWSISHLHHLLAGWPWASYITSLSQSLRIKEESNSAHLTDCLEAIMPLNLLTQYQTLSNSKIIAWYCFHSVSWSCLTLCDPWTAAPQDSLSFTGSQSLLKLMSIELVMPSNHLILCLPLLLLPSTFSSIRVFSNESVLHCYIYHWAEFPVLYNLSLVVIHLKYSSVYMLIQNSLTVPSLHPSSAANHKFIV